MWNDSDNERTIRTLSGVFRITLKPISISPTNEIHRKSLGKSDAIKKKNEYEFERMRMREKSLSAIALFPPLFCLSSVCQVTSTRCCPGYDYGLMFASLLNFIDVNEAVLAGKSTLNRLEYCPATIIDQANSRYHRIEHQPKELEQAFVDIFLDSYRKPPRQIILDMDVTDDQVHGNQEGAFYNKYYHGVCYAPLYIFCGHHLLEATKLCGKTLSAGNRSRNWDERINLGISLIMRVEKINHRKWPIPPPSSPSPKRWRSLRSSINGY